MRRMCCGVLSALPSRLDSRGGQPNRGEPALTKGSRELPPTVSALKSAPRQFSSSRQFTADFQPDTTMMHSLPALEASVDQGQISRECPIAYHATILGVQNLFRAEGRDASKYHTVVWALRRIDGASKGGAYETNRARLTFLGSRLKDLSQQHEV